MDKDIGPSNSDLLKSLRVNDDVEVGISKKIDQIPLKKPNGFFRSMKLNEEVKVAGLQDEKDNGFYILNPNLYDMGIKELRKYLLVPYTDRYDNLFVWPIKLPKRDQQQGLSWSESAVVCATRAITKWVKIESNRLTHSYDVYEAEGIVNDPNWHNYTAEDIILKAIEKQLISDPEHEIIKRLQGKA